MSIEEPNKIDLITQHPGEGYASLVMIEDSGWEDRETRTRQLQGKLNAYLSYALDGQLSEEYPEFEGKMIRIQLDCMTPPPTWVRNLSQRMADACREHKIEFVLNQLYRSA